MDLAQTLLDAVYEHAQSHVGKHKANAMVLLHRPVGEHGDLTEEIQRELLEMAKYQDVMNMIEKHFE